MTTETILAGIFLGAVVTWIPRVLPFILIKYRGLPDSLIRFLNYLPISIIFALTLSSLVNERRGHLPQFNWLEILAVLPTFWVAAKSKNILLAVLTGIILMAVLRAVA
ncbi:AzlD domain-containing protein [Streptococcus pluranimalium]|uniref:Branched-chain amino acid transporter n=2 Tax=Streptococcus TaxID=1301 RepID=V6Z6V3_STRAG|nr:MULTISPECIES: AzlD domain-containing protein [Streptococcus]ESV55324.1 branched-chain amino acid transporter [Streptococcus agalactiae LMG 14747]MDY3024390.1 AzlD domain-containing protein [Streptococcus hyovaginalis]SNV33877.1 branched-chain amino acid transport protein [Streptococcus acidominimus]